MKHFEIVLNLVTKEVFWYVSVKHVRLHYHAGPVSRYGQENGKQHCVSGLQHVIAGLGESRKVIDVHLDRRQQLQCLSASET